MTEFHLATYVPRGCGPSRESLAQCSEGTAYLDDGSLVVLKDEAGRRWFVYNDSKDFDTRVVVRFRLLRHDMEVVRLLRRTPASAAPPCLPVSCLPGSDAVVTEITERRLSSAAVGAGDHMYVRAVVVVYAQCTKPFLCFEEAVNPPECVFDFEREPAGLTPGAAPFQRAPHSGPSLARRAQLATVMTPDPELMQRCRRVYPCFRRHDDAPEILYRLVCDTERASGREVWAFYNNSTDYKAVITAKFANAQEVRPLGRTRTCASEEAGGPCASSRNCAADAKAVGQLKSDDWIANTEGVGEALTLQLTVHPLHTELFMEGTLSSQPHLTFKASATANTQPEYHEVSFEGPGPDAATIEFDQLFKCHPEKGNGLLFRLVDTSGKQWAFYNDTSKYSFTVTVELLPEEEGAGVSKAISPGPEVVAATVPESASSEWVPSSILQQTSFGSSPIRPQQPALPAKGTPAPLPAGSRILSASVAPGRTLLFLTGGLPSRFTLRSEKERAPLRHLASEDSFGVSDGEREEAFFDNDESIDEDEAVFAGAGPDRTVFPYTKIFGTKDPRVFRLVNKDGTAWAFYNDSQTTHVFVAAKFIAMKGTFGQELSSGVAPLGQAQLMRVERSVEMAARRVGKRSTSVSSLMATPSACASLTSDPVLRRLSSRDSTPTPAAHRGENGNGNRTPASNGAARASAFCPEVFVTVGCGVTQPFARATKLNALRYYLLFTRDAPAPMARKRIPGGPDALVSRESGEEMVFAHPTAAAEMERRARPDHVKPIVWDVQHRPLLFHLATAIPSPTLAEATMTQRRIGRGEAEAGGGTVVLSAAQEEMFLRASPTRWSVFNDTERYCFIVTCQLDSRGRVEALGETQARRHDATSRATPEVHDSASAAHTVTVHSALSRPHSHTSPEPRFLESPITAKSAAARLEAVLTPMKRRGSKGSCATSPPRSMRSTSLTDASFVALRSPLDRTIDEVFFNDFAVENAFHSQVTRESSAGHVVRFKVVVDPMQTVPVLEGEVVGVGRLTVRVDEPRENHLIAFNNGQPQIFSSVAHFFARVNALCSATHPRRGARGSGRRLPLDDYVEDMLHSRHLRFYRLMPRQHNGLLFRIVDDVTDFWSIFNDTASYRFTVRVVFLKGSRVEPIGNAADVTQRERQAARDAWNPSGTSQPRQRRLSESRDFGEAEVADASLPDLAAAPNFFTDAAHKDDGTARVVEVEVAPGDTELLVLAHDVVHFHVGWLAAPAVSPNRK